MTTDVLAQPTLVLNRQWQPVHVASVSRAVVLLCNDAARVVDPDDYRLMSWDEWVQLEPEEDARVIRSARLRLKVPEIICLAHFDRLPSTSVTFSRRNVAKRDHYVCQYCGAQPGPSQSRSTMSSRVRRGAPRTGPTAPPPARSATPARVTARRSKRECGCAGGRSGRSGSRSMRRELCRLRAGLVS